MSLITNIPVEIKERVFDMVGRRTFLPLKISISNSSFKKVVRKHGSGFEITQTSTLSHPFKETYCVTSDAIITLLLDDVCAYLAESCEDVHGHYVFFEFVDSEGQRNMGYEVEVDGSDIEDDAVAEDTRDKLQGLIRRCLALLGKIYIPV
jgi:hypothetical protein